MAEKQLREDQNLAWVFAKTVERAIFDQTHRPEDIEVLVARFMTLNDLYCEYPQYSIAGRKDYYFCNALLADGSVLGSFVTPHNIGGTRYLYEVPSEKGERLGDAIARLGCAKQLRSVVNIHVGYEPDLPKMFSAQVFICPQTEAWLQLLGVEMGKHFPRKLRA